MHWLTEEDRAMRKVLLLGAAALAGIAALVLVERHTGCSSSSCKMAGSLEAFRFWYWLVAIPALCIMSGIFGYLSPGKAWIWGLTPLAAQWAWEVLGSSIGTGNLGAHVVVLVQHALSAIPGVIVAEIGAYVSRRKSTTAATL
jgi:hypothetical protein